MEWLESISDVNSKKKETNLKKGVMASTVVMNQSKYLIIKSRGTWEEKIIMRPQIKSFVINKLP